MRKKSAAAANASTNTDDTNADTGTTKIGSSDGTNVETSANNSSTGNVAGEADTVATNEVARPPKKLASRIISYFLKTREDERSQKPLSERSEIELLTEQLIEETTGEEGLIQQHLNYLLNGFNVKNNPLGVDDAKRILKCLVSVAISQRKLLAGRIEKSVEMGGMFNQYYGKLQTINTLTTSAYVKMKKMQLTRDRFEYLEAVYQMVNEKSYDSDFSPDDNDFAAHAPRTEQWEEMETEGGGRKNAQDG